MAYLVGDTLPWGNLVNDINNQVDLKTALDTKALKTDLQTPVPPSALFTDTVYNDSTLIDWGFVPGEEGHPTPGSLLGIELNLAPDLINFQTPRGNSIAFCNPRFNLRIVSGNDVPRWRLTGELMIFKYAVRF